MATEQHQKRQQDRKERETFRKRKKTLLKGCHAIEQSCQAKVHLIICRKGKYFSYITERDMGWPPTAAHLANAYPPLQELTSQQYADIYVTPDQAKNGSEKSESPDHDCSPTQDKAGSAERENATASDVGWSCDKAQQPPTVNEIVRQPYLFSLPFPPPSPPMLDHRNYNQPPGS